MSQKIKEIAVKTGSYTDRSGKEKARWKNVGSILQLDDEDYTNELYATLGHLLGL